MTTRYVQPGDSLAFTPAADVKVNDVIAAGALIAVAATNIPANTSGAVLVDGVFHLPKKAGTAFSFGQKLTLSVADSALIVGAGVAGDVANGAVCVVPAAAGDTWVEALLTPGMGSKV